MEKVVTGEGCVVDHGRISVSKASLDCVIRQIGEGHFKGLVCAFDMTGKVLYQNDRVQLIYKCGSIFDCIPAKERSAIIEMFHHAHYEGEIVKSRPVSFPLTIGRHRVVSRKIIGELVSFSRGLVLKIAEEVLDQIVELELERLKILLLNHPAAGLWVTDERGVVIDVLKANCKSNLGWEEEDVIGKPISNLAGKFFGFPGEVYEIERVRKNGSMVRTRVVEGEVTLSNGQIYHVYLDTYFR